MGDIFIQKSSATISTFTNELGNGLTLEQFRNAIESIDLNNPESVQLAARSCEQKCKGLTIEIDLKMQKIGCNTDGTSNCGEFETIHLRGIKFRE